MAGLYFETVLADIVPIVLTSEEVEAVPYRYTGVVLSDAGFQGSGVAARYPNTVLSCAHVVYDTLNPLDPWLGDVHWYWKHHSTNDLLLVEGQPLRGYARFAGYQYLAGAYTGDSEGAFEWDFVAHYAYENVAGGEFAPGENDGVSLLTTAEPRSVLITGYPSGLYSATDPDRYRMHATSPFQLPFISARGAYLRVSGVSSATGNSGGPVWVEGSNGELQDLAGVVVSSSNKELGFPRNSLGIRALDSDAWSLIAEVMDSRPPPNDRFSNSIEIDGMGGRTNGSNLGATKEPGEPFHADERGGKSVWWKWMAPATGRITFTTQGSSFDTLLAVYTGDSVSSLGLVGANDESGADGTSKVTFRARSGTAYHVVVDSYVSIGGSIVLNWISAPSNDAFANRIVLADSVGEVVGSNLSGSKETREPSHAGDPGGSSVWWSWTAVEDGTVTIDTFGSDFDTLLAVYTGESVSDLVLAASNDDDGLGFQSRVTFPATAGAEYHIAVDGIFGGGGSILLHIRPGVHFAAQPQSQLAAVGEGALLRAQARGSGDIAYQWRKDGVNISGATNAIFALTNLTVQQAGAYSVAVRDEVGSAVSSNAVLKVIAPYVFTTWSGTPIYGSTDGAGDSARFFAPAGVAADGNGNVYAADSGNHVIRRITLDGIVTTFAGSAGVEGRLNGPASSATFNSPLGVAVDRAGNVYVADTFNNQIRRISVDGMVTTFAGSVRGREGTIDGTWSAARFFAPNDLAVDAGGNIYVADTLNHTIRRVTPEGVVSTLAGLAGVSGTADGNGDAARFIFPRGIAVDHSGNVYVADSGNAAIRKIIPDGAVTTFAGSLGNTGSKDGAGGAALFEDPYAVAVDALGNLFAVDAVAHTLKRITPEGVVTTVAGKTGVEGAENGPGLDARFRSPTSVAVDASGNVFVADTGNNTIRMMKPSGDVTTLAGKASIGSLDGLANEALFGSLDGLAVDLDDAIFVADHGNHTIRRILPDGTVATIAGLPGEAGSADGIGREARFNHPETPAVDGGGNVYVADSWNHTIRKIAPDGRVSTLAGLAGAHGSKDGPGTEARFFYPFAVAVDQVGRVYVADGYNHTIRRIEKDRTVATFAGQAGRFGFADGLGADARFHGPEALALDSDGNVYVADLVNSVIRKISPDGFVSTMAGYPGLEGSDDGVGDDALFRRPAGIAVDREFNVFVADTENHSIRMITPSGFVYTLAGSPGAPPSHADGQGKEARFSNPFGIAVDGRGNLYVADSGNNVIRKGVSFGIGFPDVDPAGVLLRARLSGSDLILSWPANSIEFVLEASDNLLSPSWTHVAAQPSVVAGDYSLRIPTSDGVRFYRLRK